MSVALDISSTSIRALQMRRSRVKKWANAPLPSGLIRDGLILDPDAVGRAIDKLFRSAKLPRKRVITCLTGLSFTYRILTLPRMEVRLIDEAILRTARREMSLSPEDIYLSWQIVARRRDELDFFVVAVPRNLVDAMVRSLIKAGVRPHKLDLKPLALARLANRANALIVDVEPDCYGVVLVANGIPDVMTTVIPRGGRSTLEDNIRRLALEVTKTVKFYNTSHPESPLSPDSPLLLTGELAADDTTGQLLQSETGYPVSPLVLPLKSPPDMPLGRYAAAMGLSLKKSPGKSASQYRDIVLNIFPPSCRAGPGRKILRYALVVAVLVMLVAPLFPLYQLKSEADVKTTALRNDPGMASQELRQARVSLTEAKQVEETIGKITADIENLRQVRQQILAEGGNLAQWLELVTSTIPPGASFISVDVGHDQVTVKGEADSAHTVVSYARTLEAKGGFREVRIVSIDEVQGKATHLEGSAVSFHIEVKRK